METNVHTAHVTSSQFRLTDLIDLNTVSLSRCIFVWCPLSNYIYSPD